jgi:hypothetical protein
MFAPAAKRAQCFDDSFWTAINGDSEKRTCDGDKRSGDMLMVGPAQPAEATENLALRNVPWKTKWGPNVLTTGFRQISMEIVKGERAMQANEVNQPTLRAVEIVGNQRDCCGLGRSNLGGQSQNGTLQDGVE